MTKVTEIIENFLFKKDPCATLPQEEILAKFVHRLNSQRNPELYPTPYNNVSVLSRMNQAGIKNAALLCWFYDLCAESSHFADTWLNLLSNVDKAVEKPGELLGIRVDKLAFEDL